MSIPKSSSTKSRLLPVSLGLATLVLAQLACRPVMTIGWAEVAVFAGLLLIVIGPLLWRLLRWLSDWREFRETRERAKRQK